MENETVERNPDLDLADLIYSKQRAYEKNLNEMEQRLGVYSNKKATKAQTSSKLKNVDIMQAAIYAKGSQVKKHPIKEEYKPDKKATSKASDSHQLG